MTIYRTFISRIIKDIKIQYEKAYLYTEKIKVLDWALDENAVLFFEHDPNYECCDLVRNAKGRVEMKSHFTLAEWFN